MPFYSEIPANQRFMGMQVYGDFLSVEAGSPSGVVTPNYIGQLYLDIPGGDMYISVGPSSGDWKKMTP